MKLYDLAEIDRRFPLILEAIGWSATRIRPDHQVGPCPIHHGTDANFHLDRKADGRWVTICRSQCREAGWTATRFVEAYFGLPHREAIVKAAELCQVTPSGETPTEYWPELRRRRAERAARQRTELREKRQQEYLTRAIRPSIEQILAPYRLSEWQNQLRIDSPMEFPSDPGEQARFMARCLFEPDDILWLGRQYDSGKPQHARQFRRRDEWVSLRTLPPRIAAGTFQKGSISRNCKNLVRTPFIVIESDDLIGEKPRTEIQRAANKRESAALFSFLADRFKLNLRAVIDTGNRSLHGWFDRPSPAAVKALLNLADGFAIDSPVITQAHRPLRLPGSVHEKTGQTARLCFLNPNPISQ